MPTESNVRFSIPGHKVASLGMKNDHQITGDTLAELRLLGIDLSEFGSKSQHASMGMDSLQPSVTTPSITTLVQFLQSWLPGTVNVITTARKADEIIGIDTVGDWEDEEVVQTLLELLGVPGEYGDTNNIPLADWNMNFEKRTIVRFELGLEVERLEEKRAAKMRQDSAGNKRAATAMMLEIRRNTVAFFGYNNGDNKTYGILNEPGLLAYEEVAANQAGETEWAVKDFADIQTDILSAAADLRTQSGDTVDAFTQKTTLTVATNAVSYLAKATNFNMSVQDWIDKTFKGNMRVVSAPQFNGTGPDAGGHLGENVFYLSADSVVGDGSTDGGRVWMQPVPTKFMALGVEPKAKGFLEDYSNATAGALLKRPYGVVRRYGI